MFSTTMFFYALVSEKCCALRRETTPLTCGKIFLSGLRETADYQELPERKGREIKWRLMLQDESGHQLGGNRCE